MKQFVTDNLFIVVMVAVTVLALVAVVYPWIQIDAGSKAGQEFGRLAGKVNADIPNAVPPTWTPKSDEGISNRRQAQEQVIETSLLFGHREPLMLGDKLVFPYAESVDQFEFGTPYTASFGKWITELDAKWLPTTGDVVPDAAPTVGAGDAGAKAKQDSLERARDQEIAKRAAECRIWADEATCFDKYPAPPGRRMIEKDMWHALINWWIQRDIVEVIKAVNRQPVPKRGFDGQLRAALAPLNVRQSPIKELVWTNVEENYFGLAPVTAGPAGVAAAAATKVNSLTGHVTNAKFDVVHYSFQVVMDVQNLPQLVGALSNKNFHTLLSVRYDPLSQKGRLEKRAPGAPPPPMAAAPPPGGESLGQPDYGSDPIMVVTLQFEAVFMKSPLSWRDTSSEKTREDGRKKRLEFLRKHPKLVLEVHSVERDAKYEITSHKVVLSHQQLLADPRKLDACLNAKQDDPKLWFVALYEDLMPNSIRGEVPGFPESKR